MCSSWGWGCGHTHHHHRCPTLVLLCCSWESPGSSAPFPVFPTVVLLDFAAMKGELGWLTHPYGKGVSKVPELRVGGEGGCRSQEGRRMGAGIRQCI